MEHDITEAVQRLIFGLAAILIAAKVGAEVFERFLKLPAVLGELLAGVAISPHALGGISFGAFGPLFENLAELGEGGRAIPISNELWGVAQVAAVLLLFMVGLETNLRQFLRYSGPASVVAIGGVALPFALGAGATILMGFGEDLKDPTTLFVGAIMAATSVGITARLLSEKKKLDTPEGVTILAAAVVDDVIGIILLAVVVGIAATGEVSAFSIAEVGLKAVGFWLGLTFFGILLSRYISRAFLWFRSGGAVVGLAMALALLASGMAETFDLALIIGAYSIGLALSPTPLARSLEHSLHSIGEFLVPVFFVTLGMLVDLSAMKEAIGFGVVITVLAIVTKFVGSGLPALGVGFNRLGALRIAIGMVPRGEVALVIAGIGLARGAIEQDIFGVAILMTLVTTLLAPLFLGPAFDRPGSGRRASKKAGNPRDGLPVPGSEETPPSG